MKKQGEIKSIPVKEVMEGMQVFYLGGIFKVNGIGSEYIELIPFNKNECVQQVDIGYKFGIKTLVVEYEEDVKEQMSGVEFYGTSEVIIGFDVKQISLKNSQWQKAIANGEVDSGKKIEFKIVVQESSYEDDETIHPMTYRTPYAKIIPAKKAKKKMYSEEELLGFFNYIENRRQYFKEKALIDNPEKMLEYWMEEGGK